MRTSGVRFARLLRPTAVVDSWARRMSKPSSGSSRACLHVSTGSVSVCGSTLRANTRRTTTPASRDSPTEPFFGARTVTSWPRAASPAADSRSEAGRPGLPVGEPLVDGDEDPHGYPASLPPTRSSRRSVRASQVFCSGQLAPAGHCFRRLRRKRRLDRRDELLGSLRERHVGLHAAEIGNAARDDGLAGREVLVDLERRAVPGVAVARYGIRPTEKPPT